MHLCSAALAIQAEVAHNILTTATHLGRHLHTPSKSDHQSCQKTATASIVRGTSATFPPVLVTYIRNH